MASKIIDTMSFVRGAGRNVAIVIDEFAEKKSPHAILSRWQDSGFQRITNLQYNVIGLDMFSTGALIAVGEQGQAIVTDKKKVMTEYIALTASKTQRAVPLRAVKVIGSHAYAVGMRRQAYVRKGPDDWQPIHQKILADTKIPSGFETIDGFSENEIYAAGWGGEIWQFDGKSWCQLKSPTDRIITSLICVSNENIYACGQAGTIFKGRKDEWQMIDAPAEDFWSIASFKNRIFASSMNAVFEITETGAVVVEAAKKLTESFFSLSVAEDKLWSVGSKAILSFDGDRWSQLV